MLATRFTNIKISVVVMEQFYSGLGDGAWTFLLD